MPKKTNSTRPSRITAAGPPTKKPSPAAVSGTSSGCGSRVHAVPSSENAWPIEPGV